MSSNLAEVLYRPIVFQEIQRVVWPPSWLGHTPFALWLVETVKPRKVVELGTHSGNSFSAFCQAVKTLGYATSLDAIDTWKGDPHSGNYTEDVYEELREYIDTNYGSFAQLVRATFEEAIANYKDGSIDILNIDGYHTYEATKDNFESWLPKLSENGVVLIHDINVRTADFGAWRFWDELDGRFPRFSFLHSHGLGVVAVGKEVAPGVKWLTDTSRTEDDCVQTRDFFALLGATPIIRSEYANLSSLHKQHVASEQSWSEEALRLRNDVQTLQAMLDEKSAQYAQEQAKVADEHTKGEQLVADLNEASRWRHFVQTHIAPDIATAESHLRALGSSNAQGLGFKAFVQQHLGQNVEEAYSALKTLAESNADCLPFRAFVQNNLGMTTDEAFATLKSLGDSNIQGLGFRSLVLQELGTDDLDAARLELENRDRQLREALAFKSLVRQALGDNLDTARRNLEVLQIQAAAMNSPLHRLISKGGRFFRRFAVGRSILRVFHLLQVKQA